MPGTGAEGIWMGHENFLGTKCWGMKPILELLLGYEKISTDNFNRFSADNITHVIYFAYYNLSFNKNSKS